MSIFISLEKIHACILSFYMKLILFIEFFNNTLFIAGCTPREASRMQDAFECEGVGVVVTPGEYEYSFDFV